MEKIRWILLAIGTALVCQYAQTLAAVILLIAFIGIVAVLWVRPVLWLCWQVDST